MTRVAGIVLAAGEGRRLGGPKALLRLAPDGPTLLESAVATLLAAGVGRVHVVVGAAAADVETLLVSLQEKAVRAGCELSWSAAQDWSAGMSVSLVCGLEWVLGRADGVDAAVLHLLDLPGVTPAAVRHVVDAAVPPGTPPRLALGRATYAGRPGHPVVIGLGHVPAVLDAVRARGGDAGAREYLRVTPHTSVEVGDLGDGTDVDTPADLQAANRRWRGLPLKDNLDNA